VKITKLNLEQLALKYYPFAYALLPDELMATQLIIDSITKMVVVYKDKDYGSSITIDEIFEFDFLKNIFELSVVRSDHFKQSGQLKPLNPHDRDFSFYLMSLEERACLFLRDKLNLGFCDISYIIGKNYEESLAFTHRARGEFIEIINGHGSAINGGVYAQ